MKTISLYKMESNGDVHLQEIHSSQSERQNDENLKIDKEKTTSLFLYFAATIANLNNITFGVTVVWISPVSSKLLSYNTEENPLRRPITTLELALLGCMSQIGMVFGPLLLGKLFDGLGRKRSINILSILIVTSYIILAFSKHIYLYYTMMLLIGILLGGLNVGLSLYTSEITEDHNRARFSCFTGSFIPFGNLYGFILGPFLSIQMFTLLCALPSLFMVIISELFLPESPQYLINNGKREKALKSLKSLLGPNHLRAESIANEIEYNISQKNTVNNNNSIKVLFNRKSSRNALIACCSLVTMVACSGLPAVMSYLELIFEISGTELSASISAICVGVIQIICYFAASVLVEKLGRRPLLLFSAITTTIPLSILGAYFHLININSPLVTNIRWIPIFGIIILLTTAILGICSVTWAVLNEVFNSDIKSLAMSIVHFINCFIVTITVFLFPIMMNTIGLAWSFWIFAAFCLSGFFFVYYRIPETKGKNILEIQELFGK